MIINSNTDFENISLFGLKPVMEGSFFYPNFYNRGDGVRQSSLSPQRGPKTVQLPVVNQHVCSQKSPLSKNPRVTEGHAAAAWHETMLLSGVRMGWIGRSISLLLMQMITRTDLLTDVKTSISFLRSKTCGGVKSCRICCLIWYTFT